MSGVPYAATLASALGCGLVAGVFYAYAVSVNLLWVFDSVPLVVGRWLPLTALGVAVVLAQARGGRALRRPAVSRPAPYQTDYRVRSSPRHTTPGESRFA
jgi:hypothetical protein